METISAVILTKNSDRMLEDCLHSIDFCNEIILVDDHSIDKTLQIAKKYKAKIVENTEENFAKRRELGLRHVVSEWVLYVDSDEVVSEELAEHIQKNVYSSSEPGNMGTGSRVGSNDLPAAFRLKRKNFYLGN